MCTHHREAALRACAEWLSCADFPTSTLTITMRSGGRSIELRLGADLPAAPAPTACRPLSLVEAKVLAALDAREHRSSERVAELVGVKCSDGFKALLTNLADAGVIEPLSGKGYRLVGRD